ncbi:MAG: hypothetical protein R3202_09440, partial [Candidatus Competibacterales bacterium]|nr:hypothetical protein [Candidatus Competibacterales bacterium]
MTAKRLDPGRMKSLCRSRVFPLGISISLFLVALPLDWRASILALGVLGLVSALSDDRIDHAKLLTPVFIPVLLFILSSVASTIFSVDTGKSFRMLPVFIPSLLVLYLIVRHCRRPDDIQFLFFCLSLLVSIVSFWLLCTALINPGLHPAQWIFLYGSSFFLAPNDTIFLVLVCPFSIFLAFNSPFLSGKIIAFFSIFSCISVIVIFQNGIGL